MGAAWDRGTWWLVTTTSGNGDVLGGCGSTTSVEEVFAGDGSAIVTCVDHLSFRSAHTASMLARS
jgi:hypothetical protein